MARTVIAIQCRGWQAFLAAFGILRAAGVDVTAVGGNAMTVPHDTDRAVLRAVASTGAVVHADLAEAAPTMPQQTVPPQVVEVPSAPSPAPTPATADPPRPKPAAVRKPRRSRKSSSEE